jgi:hypothetical protein
MDASTAHPTWNDVKTRGFVYQTVTATFITHARTRLLWHAMFLQQRVRRSSHLSWALSAGTNTHTKQNNVDGCVQEEKNAKIKNHVQLLPGAL